MEQVDSTTASDGMSKLVQVGSGSWCAELVADESDRFFFDHPQDHIPGMLLTEFSLRAVERCAQLRLQDRGASLYFADIVMAFDNFCEKDSPALVSVNEVDPNAGQWSVEVTQEGSRLAKGMLKLKQYRSSHQSGSMNAPSELMPRASRALVHKHIEGNVLITPVHHESSEIYQVGVIPAGLRRPYAGASEQNRALVELIEAGRQFGTLAMHTANGLPFTSQFVLQGFTLKLARPLRRTELVQMRGTPPVPQKHEVHGTEQIIVGGEHVGQLEFGALLLPQAVYARLRKRSRSAPKPTPRAPQADAYDTSMQKESSNAEVARQTAPSH